MTIFVYKGKNQVGEIVEGDIEGSTQGQVAEHLMKSGVFPLSIEEKKQELATIKRKHKPVDVLTFTRQLYVLIRSGVPISRALKSMEVSNQNAYLKEIFRDVRHSLDNGYELHTALQKHNKFFSVFYINMVRIGELTGRLEEVLMELYQYLEFEQEMKNRAKTALRYPMLVIGVMAIAFIIMMIFVIPAFAKIYEGFKAELPWPTQLLIGTSNFLMTKGIFLLFFLGLAVYWFKSHIESEKGRFWWDKIKFDFPIIGKILKKSTLARFSKSFSLSIKSGVPIVQSLGVIAQVVDNVYIGKYIEQIRESVERGNTLYNSMRATGVFEPLVLEMVSTGEEAGELDTMTQEISNLYDKEIDYDLKNINSHIEPIMLLMLGVLLVIFALGIFLPIWDLGSVVLKK